MPDNSATTLPTGTTSGIVEFFSYWSSLPKHGLSPLLSDYLDRAPPRLQPYVSMVDIPHDAPPRLRYLGTALTTLSGRDRTGKPLQLLYTKSLWPLVTRLTREVVSRPVGYICTRSIRTASGRLAHTPAICLPMTNPKSAVPVLVTYAQLESAALSMGYGDALESVQGVTVLHWIDLGAGVPDYFH
jgi:hypothetical protein